VDVLKVLKDNGGTMTAEEVAKASGEPVEKVTAELTRLVKADEATMTGAWFPAASDGPREWRYSAK
jgi:hypothetical protein